MILPLFFGLVTQYDAAFNVSTKQPSLSLVTSMKPSLTSKPTEREDSCATVTRNHFGTNSTFPVSYIVRIGSFSSGQFLQESTGTIITPLLTLCSCSSMANFEPNPIPKPWNHIRVLPACPSTNAADHRGVRKVDLHPKCAKYKTGFVVYDMSMLHLDTPLQFSSLFQPLILYSQNLNVIRKAYAEFLEFHTTCFVAGWLSEYNLANVSPLLLEAHLLPDKKCKLGIRYSLNLDVQKCVNVVHNGKNYCGMNYGHPLICNSSLLSILSSSRQCSSGQLMMFYINPVEVVKFINEELQEKRTSHPYVRQARAPTLPVIWATWTLLPSIITYLI